MRKLAILLLLLTAPALGAEMRLSKDMDAEADFDNTANLTFTTGTNGYCGEGTIINSDTDVAGWALNGTLHCDANGDGGFTECTAANEQIKVITIQFYYNCDTDGDSTCDQATAYSANMFGRSQGQYTPTVLAYDGGSPTNVFRTYSGAVQHTMSTNVDIENAEWWRVRYTYDDESATNKRKLCFKQMPSGTEYCDENTTEAITLFGSGGTTNYWGFAIGYDADKVRGVYDEIQVYAGTYDYTFPDEGPGCSTPCPDADSDGYADCTTDPTCDSTGLTCGDCDDSDAAEDPGNPENTSPLCTDSKDNDCDGWTDLDDEDCDGLGATEASTISGETPYRAIFTPPNPADCPCDCRYRISVRDANSESNYFTLTYNDLDATAPVVVEFDNAKYGGATAGDNKVEYYSVCEGNTFPCGDPTPSSVCKNWATSGVYTNSIEHGGRSADDWDNDSDGTFDGEANGRTHAGSVLWEENWTDRPYRTDDDASTNLSDETQNEFIGVATCATVNSCPTIESPGVMQIESGSQTSGYVNSTLTLPEDQFLQAKLDCDSADCATANTDHVLRLRVNGTTDYYTLKLEGWTTTTSSTFKFLKTASSTPSSACATYTSDVSGGYPVYVRYEVYTDDDDGDGKLEAHLVAYATTSLSSEWQMQVHLIDETTDGLRCKFGNGTTEDPCTTGTNCTTGGWAQAPILAEGGFGFGAVKGGAHLFDDIKAGALNGPLRNSRRSP